MIFLEIQKNPGNCQPYGKLGTFFLTSREAVWSSNYGLSEIISLGREQKLWDDLGEEVMNYSLERRSDFLQLPCGHK